MTTEILLNKLYQINSTSDAVVSNISFDMDIHNDLACVVFDEVHYINDAERGRVWEQSIMLLPPHVQMVMLSATIDQPEKFASWIESRDSRDKNGHSVFSTNSKKIVSLAVTNHRIVPLTHYSFVSCTESIFKILKDKEAEKEIRDFIDKPHIIQSSKGEFQEKHYYKMKRILETFEQKRCFQKRGHVLNQVCKHLVENQMLPALCFVLSRKQLEVCAHEVTTILLEDDSKVPYIVRRECEQIIRKLPNFQEYLELPEYVNMVALLEKGIAIHHAGVMPVLREMVELLYSKGYIKLLFATETFAIGLNMPTKTVIFTDVNKFDGRESRMLYSHEYTQMAGRAGRRGIDTVGNVIHLNNLFRGMDFVSYKAMMNGKPQTLVSKFKISYNLLFSLIDVGQQDFTRFASRSMIQEDIDCELGGIYRKMGELSLEIEKGELLLSHLKTPKKVVEEYMDLCEKRVGVVNKKRKEIDRRLSQIQEEYKNLEKDRGAIESVLKKQKEYQELEKDYQHTEKYLQSQVTTLLEYLVAEKFVEFSGELVGNKYTLTKMGLFASQLKELPCLPFARMVESGRLNGLTSFELILLFSCFTNVNVGDDFKAFTPNCQMVGVNELLNDLKKDMEKIQDFETKCRVNTGTDYSHHYDLLNYMEAWCLCKDAPSCKYLLQQMEKEKEIFLGEFVKAVLKINNVACEIEKIAEMSGNMELLEKVKQIPELTLKFVATNQSLYV
jgi:superfamily II RNA helicase